MACEVWEARCVTTPPVEPSRELLPHLAARTPPPSPMYAIAILRYRRPLEEVLTVIEEHRAYLRGLRTQGVLLASGPMDPRHGGMLLLRVPDDAVHMALDRIRDEDPFTKHGMAQYELIPWAPTIGQEGLDRL